ncbi:MAG: CRISPR-associated helicase Cas3' [Candidatus Kapabacteria bacterium]|nr:CRISPR-associated helicase Cas3' [Candidatus Kapabacteria bacterium]
MVADLSAFKSHPEKDLTVHISGVLKNVKSLTDLWIAGIAAIFHDIGKMNPNFQKKLLKEKYSGYTKHSYLSAYAFFCFIFENRAFLEKEFGANLENKLVSIMAIIAKHHGHLPNFNEIFSDTECDDLFDCIRKFKDVIPSNDYVKYFIPTINYFELSQLDRLQEYFKKNLGYSSNGNNLSDFLETQYAFACLIRADKADASDTELNEVQNSVDKFSEIMDDLLSKYLQLLVQNSDLNILRTKLRNEVTENIRNILSSSKHRVFSLTAPTGSGKTLMLLSLANEIIKSKGNFRVIYTLPFLSITEQIEKECIKIFGNEFIHRIDSKSGNMEFDKIQDELEENTDRTKDIINAKFVEDNFLSPFIITTFVRFFETVVSNINSTLLKLPSFSNCIFLIDEIQSLPPRLYTFFVAYLTAFCEKFNSYCIVSTATMPYFKISDNEALTLFKDYEEPIELSDINYFNHKLFNRYEIHYLKETVVIQQLSNMITEENNSVLVIMNTIDDTKNLFKELSVKLNKSILMLLNTHFTPNDRKKKIEEAKQKLKENNKVILISTQLIEAGVDIDFPIVYRDMALIPSIIQASGRGNRNGIFNIGKIVLINLNNRSELIYRGRDKILLNKTKLFLTENSYSESSLFNLQKEFFNSIGKELIFGEHIQKSPKVNINFVQDIMEMNFETIGKFRLIDEDTFGEEQRFYVPESETDNNFNELTILDKEVKILIKNKVEYNLIKVAKIKVEEQLKKMSNQIVQIRVKKNETPPLTKDNYFDLKLLDMRSYNPDYGVILDSSNQII